VLPSSTRALPFRNRELPGDSLQALGQFLQVIRFVVHGNHNRQAQFFPWASSLYSPGAVTSCGRYLIRLFYSWLSTRTRLVVPLSLNVH